MRYGRALAVFVAAVVAAVWMVWLRDGSNWWDPQGENPEKDVPRAGVAAGVSPEAPVGGDVVDTPAGRSYRSLESFKVNPFAQGGRFLITGQVFSEEEEPVGGANVTLYGRRDARTLQFAQPLATGGANSHGRYEMKIDFPLEGWLAVNKPGYAQVESAIRLEEPGIVSRNFTLPKAFGRIRGKVVDGLNGLPIFSAEVFLSVGPTTSQIPGIAPRGASRDFVIIPSVPSGVSSRQVRTDARGEFEFGELPERPVTLTASHSGYFEDIKTVSMSPATSEEVELRIVRGDSVSLLVKNKKGEPIAEANVRRPDYLIAKADDHGRVEIPLHPNPKPFRIKVWADGYLGTELSVDPRLPLREITLDEGPHVGGVVISDSGRPIRGAQISIYSGRERNGQWEKTIRTDETGRFETRLSDPPLQRIHVSSPGYIADWMTFEGDETPVTLSVVLKSGEGAIAGRVADFSGKPVRQFFVAVRDADAPKGRSFSKTFDNPEGSFALMDLPQGRFRLIVSARKADLLAEAMVAGMEIRKGMVLDLGTIQLEEPKAPFPVRPRKADPKNITRKETRIPIAVGDRIQ